MINLTRPKKFSSLARPASLPRLGQFLTAAALLVPFLGAVSAAELLAADARANDFLGSSVSASGNMSLAGAPGIGDEEGAAYLFRTSISAESSAFADLKLLAPDSGQPMFGVAVSLSGNTALVGRYRLDGTGAAFLYRNLDAASGTVRPQVTLATTGGENGTGFGHAVSLSGNTALVGAYTFSYAYLYRHLDVASGTRTQDVTLTAAAHTFSHFGTAVSLLGTTGLVGAPDDDNSGGAAYLFRNLDTAGAFRNEDVKLTSVDDAPRGQLGISVSLSGTSALVGALDDRERGSASLYRHLDQAMTGSTITQDARLIASDGAEGDTFGYAVSLSGKTGLVGAHRQAIEGRLGQGSAYLFGGLDTAAGTITQDVKLTASDGQMGDEFGRAVSLDGDNFIIGARKADGLALASGKAYSGSVASFTTFDLGNASRLISGLSFVSEAGWIIGQNQDANMVTLGAAETADVRAGGQAVYIGQKAGADRNALILRGALLTSLIYVGSPAGNQSNRLQLEDTATFSARAIRLAPSNLLAIRGNYLRPGALAAYLGATQLQIYNAGAWQTVYPGNFKGYMLADFVGGYTILQPKPQLIHN